MKTKIQKTNLFYALIACICSMLLSSCVSMSSMQTARTLGKGNTELSLGGSRVSYDYFPSETDTINRKTVTGEIDWRYGITDKLDIGVKASILGTAGGYAKYQFLGDQESKFAASGGAGLGYLTIESGTDENKSKTTIVDYYVPLNLSYHPKEWIGIYTSPRYTLRTAKSNDSKASASHWYGTTTGIRLGKKVAPFIEYSIFGSNASSKPLSQITGGISIGF